MSTPSKGLVLQWRGSRFYIDPILLLVTLTLLLFGYVMVASASFHLCAQVGGCEVFFSSPSIDAYRDGSRLWDCCGIRQSWGVAATCRLNSSFSA